MTKKTDPEFDASTKHSFEFKLGNIRLDESALHLILQHSHDAVVILGDDFKYEYVSDEGYRMVGAKPGELIGRDFRTYLPDDEKELVAERFTKRIAREDSPNSYSTKVLDIHGNILYVDIKAFLIETVDGVTKILAMLQNRTDEELSEAALKESEERYRTLVETMSDGLVIDDVNSILLYANDAFCKMLGYEREEIVGTEWIKLTSGITPEILETKTANRRKGESERYELRWKTKSGDTIPTIISAVPLFDENENFTGTFGVVTDITTQKDAEASVQFYLDLLTHDIANQLQVIMTSTGLLDPELPSSYTNEARHDIVDAVQRCERLITKVKRASQTRTLPRTKMDLSTVVKEKAAAVERVYSVSVNIKGLEDTTTVWADALLGELVWNILENAALHNPSDKRKIWVSTSRKNGYFKLSISDNGPGISDRKKKIIFDKSKRSGGVGLTLVYSMTRKYGGSIKVVDRVKGDSSKGSKFVLILQEAK